MFQDKQNTIANEISFSGIGLHSGQEVNVNLYPAPENHGIIFKRSDIKGKNNIIIADYRNVTKAQLGTTLSNVDNISVSTIEHFMAAIWGCRIDNLIIEMDGEEMPIVDGSSEPFVFLLESVGVKSQNAPSKILKISKEILFEEDGKQIKVTPADKFSFNLQVDFNHKVIGKEEVSFDPKYHSFRSDLCRARTFAFEKDIEQIKKLGLGKGGSLDNAIIIGEDEILNEDGLRYKNELARHKALDFIGDIHLFGQYILGHFEVNKPGHYINNKFLHYLADQISS
ncbi:UDP-3-O-acyl-N-acetylglucosamine deacetylase [Rickettsiales bacterium]|nr:UDP-3-O-acyl-N-acetylglucosamine deacetylase [Rickettsiales bacterium]MDB2550317.1 UDP-3-O-acyl-N-acetylglucosamine deacetylase [Rickettsiales bacterium]